MPYKGQQGPQMPLKPTTPYRDRHPRLGPLAGRCCWVCGKNGGWGCTSALQGAGYRMELGTVAHAHPACITKAMKQAAQHETTASEVRASCKAKGYDAAKTEEVVTSFKMTLPVDGKKSFIRI